MQVFQFEYSDNNNFRYELNKIKRETQRMLGCKIVFEIHATFPDVNNVKELTDTIDEVLPDALYFGSGAFASILEGESVNNSKAVVVCSVYENETTNAEVIYVDKNSELYDASVSNSVIKNVVKKYDWVKSIDIVTSAKGSSLLSVFEELKLDRKVAIFGGVAIDPTSPFSDNTQVFSKGHSPNAEGLVLLLLGGDDLYVESSYVVGWQPVGKKFVATKSEGAQLLEIDNELAMNAYTKYLGIQNDENFSMNAMSFPFLVNRFGIDCLTTPVSATEDGKINFLAEVPTGSQVRLGYGDVDSIVKSVNDNVDKIIDFGPESIRVYSCCGRAMYLADRISIETKTLNDIAPTNGFYTRGELLLVDDHLMMFNYTMVLGYFREGEKLAGNIGVEKAIRTTNKELTHIEKLINLIHVTSEELEEANEKLKKYEK